MILTKEELHARLGILKDFYRQKREFENNIEKAFCNCYITVSLGEELAVQYAEILWKLVCSEEKDIPNRYNDVAYFAFECDFGENGGSITKGYVEYKINSEADFYKYLEEVIWKKS